MNKILKGIDVSYSQGNINWHKVKQNGVDFAIIRSGFGSYSPVQVDNQYYNNAEGCKNNNIPFGIYHFAYFTDTEKAEKEAEFAIQLADIYKKYVKFIALDVEEDTLRYCEEQGVKHTKSSLTACVKIFLEKIKSAGYIPVLYTNYDYINNRYNFDELSKYYLWLACPDANSAGRDCGIWQYSWTGKIDGINGSVDMNFMYNDIVTSKTSTEPSTTKPTTSTPSNLKVGDRVTVTNPIIYGTNNPFTIYDDAKYTIMELINDRAVIGIGKNVTAAVNVKYLKKHENDKIKVGSKVKLKSGATTYLSTVKLQGWCYNTVFDVMEVAGDRVVIGINGNVTSAVNVKNLILQ